MSEQPDRYRSFSGLDCDRRDAALIDHVISGTHGGDNDEPYRRYIGDRLQESRRKQDGLHFIHSQINLLYDYLERLDDEAGVALLGGLEADCC